MNSYLTEDFIKYFQKLPERIRKQARKNYNLWKRNPYHPSLEFRQVGLKNPVYSVRVSIGWRALGLIENNAWNGSHPEKIIRRL